MWQQLRARRFHGLKFRRQVPVGNYVADFLCESEKLIVEVDGGQHSEMYAYDARRTVDLNKLGYRVVRFWSEDVRFRLEAVLHDLKQFVGDTQRTTPSPRGVIP